MFLVEHCFWPQSFPNILHVENPRQDGQPLNVNAAYENLRGVTVPGDVLDKVHILRCSYNYTKTCSAAEGQFTDFNFWDRAFSLEEAKDWTTCRWSSEPAPLKMCFIKISKFPVFIFF